MGVRVLSPATIKPPLGVPINRGHPLARGLVGCWLMNEGGGDKIYDLSGYSNYGTLTHMDLATDWVPGRYGPCLDFDGTDDYVEFGASPLHSPANNSLTVEALVRIGAKIASKSFGGTLPIVAKANNAKYEWELAVESAAGVDSLRAALWQANGSGYESVLVEGAAPLYCTLHVLFTYDKPADTLTLYIDGVARATDSSSAGALVDNAEPVRLAHRYWEQYNEQQVDYLRIWSRALAAQEVAELYVDPFAMFRQPRRVYYVAAGGAAAGNPWYAYAQQ